jgi:hypothetical protein
VRENTTLLTYQVTYEQKLFELMTNSQQMGEIGMACMYGETLLEFLDVEQLPQKGIALKSGALHEAGTWQQYYAILVKTIMNKIKVNIRAVRAHYGKEVKIPQYRGSGVTN